MEIVRRLEQRENVALTRWHIDGEAGQLLRDNERQAQIRPWPGVLGSKSVNWIRLGRALARQESGIENKESRHIGGQARIFHITNQTLSFLAKQLHPSVVTVHDIIELLEPQDKKAYWLNRYLYSGIASADQLICVSNYTKKTVQEQLGIPDEKITVIHNGVGPEFHPIPDFPQTIAYQELRHSLKLPAETHVVLYVGSDHPRKNVVTALRAFVKARSQVSEPLIFLKVGAAGLPAGRAALLEEIDRAHVRDAVRFVDAVSTQRLNELYNLADVLIFPSRHEGFGLPALQAMAAGTPIITSNATSLPEVVGEAAFTHDPDDVDAFAGSLVRLLTDPALSESLAAKGRTQAVRFSWDAAAAATEQVYQKLADL
jgi:glycosyltransferase involved in cell wall biosynthesis